MTHEITYTATVDGDEVNDTVRVAQTQAMSDSVARQYAAHHLIDGGVDALAFDVTDIEVAY